MPHNKDRREQIKQIIQLKHKITVSDLSEDFNVTPETIRRDLTCLELEGFVTRTYGGAVLREARVNENSHFMLRAQRHNAEKKIIAELVYKILPKRGVIATDASSTAVEAVRRLKDDPEITILTNSTQVVSEFSESMFRIVSTGGTVNKITSSMQGSIVRSVLKDFYVDVVLLSCKALNMSGGIFDSNEDEAEIKKLLVDRGQKIILLADHSKFDKVAFIKLLDFEKLDVLVTDRELSNEWKNFLIDKNVLLIHK
ncbi:MAG: DeoR/GlpR transcriptional regulator [Synergistaceae bacterium]|nr:DeoR/GlpR transcriptional regulator [Synergistaceae bacterium]